MEKNKKLELKAMWDIIDHLELRLEEIEDMGSDGPLSEELTREYIEKNKTVNELLDKIDEYQGIIDECSGDNESDMDLGIYYSIRIKELKTIYNKL